jgi:glycosyltransferase involved in cell wall biosynthesis
MSTVAIDARESGTSTGRYVDKLIEYLYKLRPDLDIVILAKPQRLDFFKAIVPEFKTLSCQFREFTFAEQLSYLRQLHKLHADLVHFSIVQQPVLYRGKTVTTMQDLTTVRFKNPSKNPIVFFIKQNIYIVVNKWVARKSQALITATQYVKDDVVNFTHVDPVKITVTYEAADVITKPAEPLTTLVGKQYIMYLGRPMPHKNLERLIEAYAKLKPTQPNLQLVLAGQKDANYDQIEAMVKTQDISDVFFTGFISEGQLRWLYEHCAAYVFPSLSEGFGLPGLEAMVHGAPVVCSNASCLPEVYGDAVHYFDPLNVEAITKAISEVLTDNVLRQRLIAAGQAQVKKYSWQRMAEQTLEVYKKVLEKNTL